MFKRITIKNFRSCVDTTLELDGSICALSGRNGVGKSNILKAIEWVCESVRNPLRINHRATGNPWLTNPTEVCFLIELNEQRFSYKFKLFNPTDGSEPTYSQLLEESLFTGGAEGDQHILFTREVNEVKASGREGSLYISRSTPALSVLASMLPENKDPSSRIADVHRFLCRVSTYRIRAEKSEKEAISVQEYLEWRDIYRAEKRLTDSVGLKLIFMDQELKDVFEEFKSLICSNGLDVLEDIRIDQSYGSGGRPLQYIPNYRPALHMGGSHSYFPFDELSEGTQRIIRILLAILFDERSVLLIEEPEDSIHPGLLRSLTEVLRAYSVKAQIIFTSHSPDVLNIMKPEELILVTAPEGKTEARKLSESELSRVQTFLKNEGTLAEFLEPIGQS